MTNNNNYYIPKKIYQEIMEAFIDKKEDMVKTLKKLQDDVDLADITDEEYKEKSEAMSLDFNESIHKVWKQLMKLELTIHEQLEDVNSTFEHDLTEMVNYFIEQAQGYFAQVRNLEQIYHETITEVSQRIFTMLSLQEDLPIPPELETVSENYIINNCNFNKYTITKTNSQRK